MDFSDETFSPGHVGLPVSWAGHEYEACRFEGLDMAGGSFKGASFIDCVFAGCNLANASLEHTRLNDVRFEDCKLTGVDFGKCSAFAFQVGFKGCGMELTIFLRQNLKKIRFTACRLREAHFHTADLQEAVFEDCDLENAQFSDCDLRKADLSTATNLRLDPDQNKLKGARFSLQSLPGLLDKYGIRVVG